MSGGGGGGPTASSAGRATPRTASCTPDGVDVCQIHGGDGPVLAVTVQGPKPVGLGRHGVHVGVIILAQHYPELLGEAVQDEKGEKLGFVFASWTILKHVRQQL